jgi:hypothetical protein
MACEQPCAGESALAWMLSRLMLTTENELCGSRRHRGRVCSKSNSLPRDRNPSHLLFTQQEMDAIVDEAKSSDRPVAAHCVTSAAVTIAAKVGVTTVKHGVPT